MLTHLSYTLSNKRLSINEIYFVDLVWLIWFSYGKIENLLIALRIKMLHSRLTSGLC